jgi:hypothetical protein
VVDSERLVEEDELAAALREIVEELGVAIPEPPFVARGHRTAAREHTRRNHPPSRRARALCERIAIELIEVDCHVDRPKREA